MNYFIFKMFFPIILLILFAKPKNSKELFDDDFLLLVVVKNAANFRQFLTAEGFTYEQMAEYAERFRDTELTEHLGQEYKLGLVHLMRERWHCAKISAQFEGDAQKECQKFRNYFGVLYEYLFREFAGLPAVRPAFYFDKIHTLCTLPEVVKSLATIWCFFFVAKYGEKLTYKLDRLFETNYELKLFNEAKLNYGANNNAKAPLEHEIVQMAIEWRNENLKESAVEIFRHQFDRLFEEMFIKMAGNANTANFTQVKWLGSWAFEVTEAYLTSDQQVFIEFSRGAPKFEQFCDKLQCVQQFGQVIFDYDIPDGIFEERRDNLMELLGTHFGVFYLMRQNWQCAKMDKKIGGEQKEREQCEKYRRNLDILYEYAFKIFAISEEPSLAQQFPAVRPFFKTGNYTDVIKTLSTLSKNYFASEYRKRERSIKLDKDMKNCSLQNEHKLRNYKANFGNLTEKLRKKFDENLKGMLKKAREFEKAHNWQNGNKEYYSTIWNSPFYDGVLKVDDRAFVAFVKGRSTFDTFCAEFANELTKICEEMTEEQHQPMFDQQKEYLAQKYAAHLGVVYLMRENWHCAKIIGSELGGDGQQKECQKFHKYFNIFYKYLFCLYAEDDDPISAINGQLIIRKIEQFGTLIDVIKQLNQIAKFFFDAKRKMENAFENSLFSRQNFEQIFETESETRTDEEGLSSKKQFDLKLKELLKWAQEKASEKRSDRKTAEKETTADGETKEMTGAKSDLFDHKFGILFDSPFSEQQNDH